MSKKILIVEDDQFFREALRDLLKKKYSILEAPNGKSAKEILSIQTVDVVLSDIQMPGLTGVELLEWSKVHKPVPFIIMTGFSAAIETKSAFEHGAKGFLAKPFKNSELFAAVESILGSDDVKQTPVVEHTRDYCKVSIDEFVSKPKIEFDVYIKLSELKMIKIAHKGQELPKEKVTLLKTKGLKYLFILKEDFSKIVDFNMGLAKLIHKRTDISSEKKMNFLKYTGEVLLEKTFVEGLNKESMYDAKSFLEMTMSTITESEETLDLLSILNSHSDLIYAHSLGVSLYSVMIAKILGFESNHALFKLSLAGLFHDIGKKEIDQETLYKPRHLVSKEERKLIESHVVRGQSILGAMSNFPSESIQMVLEHHEDLEGMGYPLGKVKPHLHPMSKILQCANIFVEQTLGGPNGVAKSAFAAIEYIETIYAGRVDPDSLSALKFLFKTK